MAFYAVEIDVCPAYGWQGGPVADVLIRALQNRHERRNRRGDLMQHSYTLPFQNVTSLEYLDEIKHAFMAMGGPTHSFLAKDWWDHTATAAPLGTAPAGSTPVQLMKVYTFGSATYSRPITKPSAGVVMYQNGIAKAGTYSTTTGIFTPNTAWSGGTALTWSGEFRVPVRFADFSLQPSIDSRSGDLLVMNGSCSLIEVFGE